MTDTLVLSKEHQEDIANHARVEAAQSKLRFKKPFLWSVGLAVAAVAVAIVAPPVWGAIIPAIPAAFALLTGSYAAGHAMNERAMNKVIEDVGKEGFAERLHERTEELSESVAKAKKISFIGMLGYAGTALGSLLFPPLSVLTPLGSLAWGGGAIADVLASERAESFGKVDARVQELTQKDASTASALAANENAPGMGLKHAPSPAAGFKMAANGATPSAVVDDTPKARPPAITL